MPNVGARVLRARGRVARRGRRGRSIAEGRARAASALDRAAAHARPLPSGARSHLRGRPHDGAKRREEVRAGARGRACGEGGVSAPETILRKQILDALHARGIWAQANNIRLKGRAKQGLGIGSPDIIALVTVYADIDVCRTARLGRLLGLEVKLPKGGAKHTEEQKAWARAIN